MVSVVSTGGTGGTGDTSGTGGSGGTEGGIPTGARAAVERPPRRLGDALLRIATVGLGSSLPAGALGAALFFVTWLLGEAGGVKDLIDVFVGFALLGLTAGAVLAALEEVALRTARPGVVHVATTLAMTLLALALVAALAGSDGEPLAAVVLLVAAPFALLGPCRTGALGGGAPLLVRFQALLFTLLAALEGWLIAGPLADVLGVTRDQGASHRLMPSILVGTTLVGALLCLVVGDGFARRWRLDPRPEPHGGALVRGVGCLLVGALLTLVVAVLVATRGLQVAIDVWPPRVQIDAPLDATRVDGGAVVVRGRVQDAGPVKATVVREPWSERRLELPVDPDPDGRFAVEVPLGLGFTRIEVVAVDGAGNTRRASVSVDSVHAFPDQDGQDDDEGGGRSPWDIKGR